MAAGDAAPALQARARERVQALQAALPGLAELPLTRADLDALEDDAGDAAAPLDDVLQRAGRHAVLQGRWPGGTLALRLHDQALRVELEVDDGRDDAAREALPALLRQMCEATGWSAWQGDVAASAEQAAAAAWQRRGGLMQRVLAAERRHRRLQAAGPAAALAMTLVAWGLALLLLAEGWRRGSLAMRTDGAPEAVFVTERLAGARPGLNLPPRYRLAGRVEGHDATVSLEVSRASYLRAAPGARLPVVPTADASQPYLLAPEAPRPLLRGQGWGLAPEALAAVLPLGLWGAGVALPLARRPGPATWVSMSRRALFLAGVLAVAAAAFWLGARAA